MFDDKVSINAEDFFPVSAQLSGVVFVCQCAVVWCGFCMSVLSYAVMSLCIGA